MCRTFGIPTQGKTRTRLSRAVWPWVISSWLTDIPNSLAKIASTALLALPSSGAVRSQIFRVPFSMPTLSTRAPGTYTVSLAITDNVHNCKDTVKKTMQIFPIPLMDHGRLRAGAVLHARVDAARKRARMDMAAAAHDPHGAVLGHFKRQQRQIKDLACLPHIGHRQLALAGLALPGNVVELVVF